MLLWRMLLLELVFNNNIMTTFFKGVMESKTNEDLIKVLQDKDDYMIEAIESAKKELKKRGVSEMEIEKFYEQGEKVEENPLEIKADIGGILVASVVYMILKGDGVVMGVIPWMLILFGSFWFGKWLGRTRGSDLSEADDEHVDLKNKNAKYSKWFFFFVIIVVVGWFGSFIFSLANNNFDVEDDFVKDVDLDELLYDKYLIEDVGSIYIPKTMELASGDYKVLNDAMLSETLVDFGYSVTGDMVVFQQVGLNDGVTDAFDTFARITVVTVIGNVGDYAKLTDKYGTSSIEFEEFGDLLEEQFIKSYESLGVKIINWYGLSVENINGITAVKLSFIRQLDDNPYVYVEIYFFQNNDRMHQLTFAYRQEDEAMWKDSFQDVLRSFVITNIK